MNRRRAIFWVIVSLCLVGLSWPAFAEQNERNGPIKRVLLIRIDGMRALDSIAPMGSQSSASMGLIIWKLPPRSRPILFRD